MRREPPKPSPDAAAIGRLALRGEGPDWNAYYAMPHTMEGALRLGSIAMAFVVDSDEIKQAFMTLMRAAVGPDMGVKASGGIRTLEDLRNMAAAGASRIGASASVKIIEATAA